MSMAAHHAEWLSLVDVSGPFLSVPVLVDALPNGLDAHDPVLAAQVREAMDVWADPTSAGLGSFDSGEVLHAWVRFVIERILGLGDDVVSRDPDVLERFEATIGPGELLLRPDAVLLDGEIPRMLITTEGYPAEAVALADDSWSGSPQDRMVEHLRAVDCRLGLVTDGERWTLVSQRTGENPGFATWWASLWREERITLQAFRTRLDEHRFVSVPDDETLEGLLVR
jgi:hypothetical protein